MQYLTLIIVCAIFTSMTRAEPENDIDTPSSNKISTRAGPAINASYGNYDSSCWSTLNLSHWMSNWYNTTPPCPAGINTTGARCRLDNEVWTESFLRISLHNTGGASCVLLQSCLGNPPDSNDIKVQVNDIEAARYRYVCYNIYAINFFFSNWYTAMYNAATQAGNLISAIVEAIDPPTQQRRVVLNDLLSALGAGLAFLAIPEAAALGGAAAAIAPIFLTAIQQAPGIGRLIWPIGSIERTTMEISVLLTQLDTVIEALSPRIAQALSNVMGTDQTDISTFLAFAETTHFSGPRHDFPDLTQDTRGLLIGFTTFLVSEALSIDGWHVAVSLDTNPLALEINGSAACPEWVEVIETQTTTSCDKFPSLGCTTYDDFGQCQDSYWRYSQTSKTSFTLAKDSYYGYWQSASKAERHPSSILHTIFENRWSTGQLLLENAGYCVLEPALWQFENSGKLGSEERISFAEYKEGIERTHINVLEDWRSTYYSRHSSQPIADDIALRDLRVSPPNGTNYTITNRGVTDYNCTTQLNLTIYSDWPSIWYLHRKLT